MVAIALHSRKPVESGQFDLGDGGIDIAEGGRCAHLCEVAYIDVRSNNKGQSGDIWQDIFVPLIRVVGVERDALQELKMAFVSIGELALGLDRNGDGT